MKNLMVPMKTLKMDSPNLSMCKKTLGPKISKFASLGICCDVVMIVGLMLGGTCEGVDFILCPLICQMNLVLCGILKYVCVYEECAIRNYVSL